ncbi:MAG: ATP-binding protein [Halobacteria archaeon]|nr:ATP-binding protein [Halobacteria archaeon]
MSESHGSFRKIVESLDDGVVVTQEGSVTYVNDTAAEILGRARDEVKGGGLTDFVSLEEEIDADEKLEGEVMSDSEADGKPVEVETTEIKYEGSSASLVVLRDITERKEMEEILECIQMIDRSVLQAEEEDDLLNWACEVLASRQKGCTSIAVLDDDGDLSDVYSAGRLSGSDGDKEANGWHNVYTDAYVDEVLENEVLVIDDVTQPPHRHHTDESAERHGAIGVALSHRGNDYGAMTVHLPPQGISETERSLLEGFAYDLSAGIYALRTEDRIKNEHEELILLNRIVRHDIRNDMNLILGWGSELREYVDSDGEEYLERVLDASKHVVDLTKTARDFVESIESGETSDLGSVSLRETVEHVTRVKRETYDDAEFRVEGIPDVDVKANSLLSTIFRNLLNNAVQHNNKEIPRIEVSAERRGDREVVVSVSDNGTGVSDDSKESIFGKEEKGLESRGTGIGLYLVDTLVDEYGGDVWVEDREDTGSREGSVFKVRLRQA